MSDAMLPSDIAKLSFEDALKELDQIVRELEGGKGKLEEAIRSYERGDHLRRHCEAKLAEAQAKIEKITFTADGNLATEPAPFE